MEPPPFDPPPSPVPPPRLPPEPPPPRRSIGGVAANASRGSHPGGWAAVAGFGYGVVGVVLATVTLIAAVAANAVLGAGATSLRNSDAEVSAADVAILERGADVITSPMIGLGLITLVLGIAATAAGIGMLRRSERARAALVVVLAASAVACVGWCVYSITSYSAAVHAWAEEYNEASSRLGLGAEFGPALGRGGSAAVTDACVAGVHLAVIAGLVAALRSASARAWCGASGRPLSKQALERARLPR